MTTKTDESNDEELPDPHQGSEFTSWEFFTQPTTDDVVSKLEGLPEWWGLRPESYVEYIQPLSQSKNFSTDKTRKDYRTTWTLYVTVAGRIAMIRDAASINGWSVDFEPEPQTPTGIPGMLQFDSDRIVYREYVRITADGVLLGRKPGTAWVPASGGGGAVSSNRFEKVETSARGRAIAAWGFGILPGSGVASLDEMLSLTEMKAAVRQERTSQQASGGPPKSRDEMDQELLYRLTEFQQISASTDEQMDARVKGYVKTSFGKEIDHNADGSWDLSILKSGEIILFRNRMIEETQKIKNEKGI